MFADEQRDPRTIGSDQTDPWGVFETRHRK
jgi:hypothetical protein